MTRRKFRDLLLIYLLLALAGSAYGIYLGTTFGRAAGELVSKIEIDASVKKDIEQFHEFASEGQAASTYISTASLLLLIAAWVGLFNFWKPARVIFGGYLLLVYLLSPIFEFDPGEIPAGNRLFDFYCRVLMDHPGFMAEILGTVTTAFDTLLALVVFTASGSHLFDKNDAKSHG